MRALLLVVAALPAAAQNRPVHVWEKQEIALQAQNSYQNPYTEVDVWVDLSGQNFHKRVYGFWDGGKTFRVRVLATAPGEWSWVSGSNRQDAGLSHRLDRGREIREHLPVGFPAPHAKRACIRARRANAFTGPKTTRVTRWDPRRPSRTW